MVVVPKDYFSMSAPLPVTLEEYRHIKDGKLFVYGYGFVKYLEVFSEEIRETRFCHCYEIADPSRLITEGFRPCVESPDSYHKAT